MVTPGQTTTPPPSHALSPIDDGLRRLPLRPARLGFHRMRRGEQLHVRADLHVVADGDTRDVEDDEAEVDERSGADVRLVAVVAVERGPNLAALPERSEQVEEDAPSRRRVLRRRLVELLREQRRASALLRENGVVRDVQVACEHSLTLASTVGACHRGTIVVHGSQSATTG